MPELESALYVPLRSNAKSLLAGAPVAALRRRLKYASVLHQQLILESGVLRMHAGAGGSFSVREPALAGHDLPQWQTARQRHAAEQAPFQVAVGREAVPGVPSETMRPALASDSAISWTATLHPFAWELPLGADWVHFGRFIEPGPSVRQLAQQWTWAGQRNAQLERAIPERFVRDAVTGHVNDDLAVAAAVGCTITVDGFHAQVVAQRFGEQGSWKLRGFAIPAAFPQIGDWPWPDIADLRRDRHMARFRAVMREIEEEAAAEAARGDIEQAAHRAYERHLAEAVPSLAGIGPLPSPSRWASSSAPGSAS